MKSMCAQGRENHPVQLHRQKGGNRNAGAIYGKAIQLQQLFFFPLSIWKFQRLALFCSPLSPPLKFHAVKNMLETRIVPSALTATWLLL